MVTVITRMMLLMMILMAIALYLASSVISFDKNDNFDDADSALDNVLIYQNMLLTMILMAIALYLASFVSSFDNSPHLAPGSLQPPSHNG